MLLKTLLPSLVALVCVLSVSARPQITTAIPFGVVDGSDPVEGSDASDETLSGVIVGTGAGGTTYVLSDPPIATDDSGITVTLVENASAASAVAVLSEDDSVATETIGCGFSGSSAVCTQGVVAATDSFTFSTGLTTSGVAGFVTVVASTSNGANVGGSPVATATGSSSAPSSSPTQSSASTQSSGAATILTFGFSSILPAVLVAIAVA